MPTTQVLTLTPVRQLTVGDDLNLHLIRADHRPVVGKLVAIKASEARVKLIVETFDMRVHGLPGTTVRHDVYQTPVELWPHDSVTVVTTLESVEREYIVVDFTGPEVSTIRTVASDIDGLVLTGSLEGALKNHADVGIDQDLVRSLVHDDTVIGMIVAAEVSWAMALYRETV